MTTETKTIEEPWDLKPGERVVVAMRSGEREAVIVENPSPRGLDLYVAIRFADDGSEMDVQAETLIRRA